MLVWIQSRAAKLHLATEEGQLGGRHREQDDILGCRYRAPRLRHSSVVGLAFDWAYRSPQPPAV
jgi:hypothetical protein